MKRSGIYLIITAVVFVLISNSHNRANEIEKKFIQAGLVDVHVIDKSIKVDLVNSDPQKTFFRQNFYDGLTKAYLLWNCS